MAGSDEPHNSIASVAHIKTSIGDVSVDIDLAAGVFEPLPNAYAYALREGLRSGDLAGFRFVPSRAGIE